MQITATFPIMAALMCLAVPAAACTPPAQEAALQKRVIAMVNAARADNGLAPLKVSKQLEKAAQGHACDSAARGQMSHISSDGSKLPERLQRVGYTFAAASENVAYGYDDAGGVMNAWMNSPGHRRNILGAKVREIGVGLAMQGGGDPELHWVLNFGATQ